MTRPVDLGGSSAPLVSQGNRGVIDGGTGCAADSGVSVLTTSLLEVGKPMRLDGHAVFMATSASCSPILASSISSAPHPHHPFLSLPISL